MFIEPTSLARQQRTPANLIYGRSPMAERIRAYDWTSTALGRIDDWPEILVCSVNLMLGCAFPSLIFWGRELVQLYNDAAVPLLVDKHPSGLGQKAEVCWAEGWHIIGPNLERVMRNGETVYFEDALIPILRDGRLQDIFWTYNYSPIYSAAGEILGVLDISQKTTQRLSQVLSVTNDAIVSLDRKWIITYMNPRAAELYASDRQVLGRNMWEAFPSAVYEDSPYQHHYYRAMQQGISGAFDAYYPEPLNLWLRIEVYPTPEGIVTFSRDITEERAAREALKEKSEQAERQRMEIESVYRTAPIGLALFDTKDFRYLRLNDKQAEFFGLKPEEIVGRTLTEMATIEGLKQLFDQVLEGRPVVNFPLEGELVTRPGEHRYWTVSYFPVMAPDGTVQAITAASLEVTHQKKAERALIQSEKLAVVGRLAASIAHEINNPLEAITNLLFLAGHNDDPNQIKEFLQMAELELRRVSVIVNQTLRFYRQSTSPQETTGEQLITSVVAVFQSRIGNSGIQVEERKRALQPVRCFEGEIRQVLSNLFSNAIDAMQPAGGRLLLRNRLGRDWKTGRCGIVLTIADTGSGISADVRGRIFEPFYTTKGQAGTGLGLWISSEIISRHQGALHIRSRQKPGHGGTVVTVFLPFNAVTR